MIASAYAWAPLVFGCPIDATVVVRLPVPHVAARLLATGSSGTSPPGERPTPKRNESGAKRALLGPKAGSANATRDPNAETDEASAALAVAAKMALRSMRRWRTQ